MAGKKISELPKQSQLNEGDIIIIEQVDNKTRIVTLKELREMMYPSDVEASYVKTVNSTSPDSKGNVSIRGNQIPCWDGHGLNKGNIHNYIDYLCGEVITLTKSVSDANAEIQTLKDKVAELSGTPV